MNEDADIVAISNELEFGLENLNSEELISETELPVDKEVNNRDVAELNVSKAEDPEELNYRVENDADKLRKEVEELGGFMYGGGSVLKDVENVEPSWYRSTALSENLAEGLLDMAGQQIVFGVNDEELGFELYDAFIDFNPILLALSTSSPTYVEDGELSFNDLESRRMEQYIQLCDEVPDAMYQQPEIEDLEDFNKSIRSVSEDVKILLDEDAMDTNWEELTREREDGAYYPFDTLAPHQVYWQVRPRPDHRNIEDGGESLFSIEVRSPDMPTTVERIQTVNDFAIGLAYHVADEGYESINGDADEALDGSYDQLIAVAEDGLDSELKGFGTEYLTEQATDLAISGLENRGYENRAELLGDRVDHIIENGTDSEYINSNHFNEENIRRKLADRLREGEQI